MRHILILGFILFIISCKPDPASLYIEKDLMSSGIPIKIMAPADPEIHVEDYGFLKDVTVKKGEKYYLQIIESDVISYDAKEVKSEKFNEVKNAPFFSKILLEEENGFVYEKKIDDTTYNYDFRYIKIQGDKQYVFQRGLIGLFELADVQAMYESVK